MSLPVGKVCRINRALVVLVAILVLPVAGVRAEDAVSDRPAARRLRTPDIRPLRPALSISDRILPIQLVDTTDGYMRMPKRNNLRPAILLATLGSHFDPAFMAQNKPTTLVEEPSEIVAGTASDTKLVSEIKNLNLSLEMSDVLPEAINAFERWLLDRATCPIRFVWGDVGPLFWPRWIKRGECFNVPGRSCSWPEGQRCVPAESMTVHLLRWHCRPRKSAGTVRPRPDTGVVASGVAETKGASVRSKLKAALAARRTRKQDNRMYRCQWLKVPYPVTAECFCSC